MSNETTYSVVSGKKKTGAIIGAAAGILIAGSGILYATVPSVKNSVRMATMKPEKYCSTIYNENMSVLVKMMDKGTSETDEIKGCEASIEIKPESGILEDAFLNSLGYVPFEKVSFDMSAVFCDSGDTVGDFEFKADDKKVINTEYIFDCDGEAYIKIPQLSEKYISYNILDLLTTKNLYTSYKANLPSLNRRASSKEYIDVFSDYIDIISETMGSGEVSLNKKVKTKVETIDCEYNVITTLFESEDLKVITNKILDKAETDQNLKNIFIEQYGNTEDDYISEINELRSKVEEIDYTLNVETYVDANGMICGINLVDSDAQKMEIMYATEDKKSVFSMSSNDNDAVISCYKLDDKYMGNIQLKDYSSNNQTFNIDFEGIEFIDGKYLNGIVSVDTSEISDGQLEKVSLKFEKENDSQKISTSVSEFGDISLSYKYLNEGISDADKPANAIDESNIDEYVADIDIEKAIREIGEAIGLKEDDIEALTENPYF